MGGSWTVKRVDYGKGTCGQAGIQLGRIVEDENKLSTMVRRTTICALAAVIALCVVPPAQSRAQSTAEKYPVVWLAEVQNRRAIEREPVSQRNFSSPSRPRFPQSFSVAHHLLTYSLDGRAPPRISTAC